MILAWLACGRTAVGEPLGPASSGDLQPLRDFYLRSIHELRDYRPGKVSYVEGPDRRWGSYTRPGQRTTLLDVAGPGCLCHIWSTWREGSGNHRLEIYLDGATRPQIAGTLDELIAAARAIPDKPVPVPGFVGNRLARNLFLAIPFQRGLRIEIETIEPTWLIFWQIDYRLGPSDQRRVEASLVDGKPVLHVTGTSPPAPSPIVTEPWRGETEIGPQETRSLAPIAGPAIVRRWSLVTDSPLAEHDKLDLAIAYDGASRPAVRATVADFFGPFRGAALWTDAPSRRRTCHLPMPIARSATFTLRNRSARPVKVEIEAQIERVAAWKANWGYLHALEQCTPRTEGFRQHEVLYVRGRGHWLGMALYNTGHDHGGGDFAVIDAEDETPSFLHGINGEDYFTFAWFGRGEHPPFAEAHTNEQGRYRHHLENPYPFRRSLSVYWGTYPDLATRSVAWWYQDSPDDTTLAPAVNPQSVEWDCFGPVPLRLDAEQRPQGDPFAVLPAVADLDAGRQFECRCVGERFTTGWMRQRSIGPMLDLTYLPRHGTRIKGEVELGGMGHALLARRFLDSPAPRTVTVQLAHDDPLRVLVNGREAYRGPGQKGFVARRFPIELRAGRNEIVVQLTSFFNVNFNWAGFTWETVDAEAPAAANARSGGP